MAILLFTPHCKNDDCDHKYGPVYLKTDILTEDTLYIIHNELSDHHNYHYVVQIRDMLGFWGCAFQLKLVKSSEREIPDINNEIETIFQQFLDWNKD